MREFSMSKQNVVALMRHAHFEHSQAMKNTLFIAKMKANNNKKMKWQRIRMSDKMNKTSRYVYGKRQSNTIHNAQTVFVNTSSGIG